VEAVPRAHFMADFAAALPAPSSRANSSSVNVTSAAATFSSRWATVVVPGIGSITGLRFSSQASET
jgi:hypothetical protein